MNGKRVAWMLVLAGLAVVVGHWAAGGVLAGGPYWEGPEVTDSVGSAPPAGGVRLEKGYPRPCEGLVGKFIPKGDVEAALEDPTKVSGWGEPANPNKPVSWTNPRQRWLTIKVASKPYHPLYNPVVYKSWCAR